MKHIGLFRYHTNLPMCKNRLEFIKRLNPEINIYGLYGGAENDFPEYETHLKDYLDGNYCLRHKSNLWKWKNGDLAIRQWFIDFGNLLDFDKLYMMEWDLIMLKPLKKIYAHIPPENIGMTGLVPLESIEKKWFWTRDGLQATEWKNLKNHVEKKYNFSGPYFASVGPGLSLTKTFLEKYANIEIPEYCNDELRLPIFAKALGFDLKDTQFMGKWFSHKEKKYFNCNEHSVTLKTIIKELNKKNGRRIFHPVRAKIEINQLLDHKNLTYNDSYIL